ncbi:MAG: lysophospholipid acyltransferase family protein, partial [Chitinophagales bacterium]
QLMQRLYAMGKSVIITGGHYNNWELFAVTINQQIPHDAAALYTHLSNPFLDKKFLQTRSKYGLQMVPKEMVKQYFEEPKIKPFAMIFGSDQSPASHSKNYYRMRFLNQETAVLFGSEKYAKAYNCPVVYMRILKLKRGYYVFESELVEADPATAPYGSITEKHTRLLERDIIRAPQYWIWTHRRWKIKLPPLHAEKS